MANWIRAARAAEIPEGGCRLVEVGPHKVALFRVAGAFHAIDDMCSHRGGPLSEGMLEGNVVTCPWHHWSYDVTTGRNTTSAEIGVRTFPVEMRGEDLYVGVE